MLPPAEEDLVRRERELPGLAVLLDLPRLAERIGRGPLRQPYLRLKPGTNCVLAALNGEGHLPAVAVIADTRARHAERRANPKLREQAGVTWMRDEALTVLPFGLDRDLPALSRLIDPERRRKLLSRLVGPGLADADATLLRYNPNRRAVLRLDGSDGPLALARAAAARDWPRIVAGARLGEALGGARVLATAEERALLISAWVEGHPLWCDGVGLGGPADIAATGEALAWVHGAGDAVAAMLAHRTGIADEVDEMDAATAGVAALLPSLAARTGRLTRDVAAALAGHDRQVGPVHGDFSADQVVLAAAGPVLVDWDRAGIGDPARDLGSFLARIDVQVIDGDLDASAADRAREALLGGYALGARLPPGIAAQHARSLLILLSEGFRHRRVAWPERMTAILDRTEAILNSAIAAHPRPGASGDAASDALARLLPHALDPDHIGPEIARATGLAGALPVKATLLRRKAGRRALIRYTLDECGERVSFLGKLRAKGPDRRTPRLHDRLRAAGLDGAGPGRIGVPRVLGEIQALHLWLQEEVGGRRVTDHLRPGGSTRPAALVGAALARLHACGVEGGSAWTLGDERKVLESALGQAAAALPRRADRISALLAASSAVLTTLGEGPVTGIHRDWYPDQALINGEAVWILDLDLHAQGDPAIDLGNFAAHVRELAIRQYGDPAALASHESAFLDGYAAGGGRLEQVRFKGLRAASLARLVGVSLRIPDRQPATDAILDVAERLVRDASQDLCRSPQT